MMPKGRGWHGELGRHSLAARGFTTVAQRVPGKKTGAIADVESVRLADAKMERILNSPSRRSWVRRDWPMSISEQEKFTKDLEDIIHLLRTVELGDWLDEEVRFAAEDIKTAWSSKSEQDRLTGLELVRENLHTVILVLLGKDHTREGDGEP